MLDKVKESQNSLRVLGTSMLMNFKSQETQRNISIKNFPVHTDVAGDMKLSTELTTPPA